MEKLIMGVDGGNSKTDYFLFTDKGTFVDYYRGPTCSHEQFKDGYEGAYRAMKDGVSKLLDKHGLKPANIAAAAFGLAGVDTPNQKANIEKIVSELGFSRFQVVNDSFLGIKAITEKGYGVCSINGTGTSCGAIDRHGNCLLMETACRSAGSAGSSATTPAADTSPGWRSAAPIFRHTGWASRPR